MTLPEIVLPKIELPFEMPILLHPVVDHFLIAIPVVVLLLELMNLMMKKKTVGGVSFFLLILTVLFSGAAYLTGLADGKEAFPALAETAKTALSEHKLLGIYLMLGSVVVLFFKLLAMTGNKVLKGIYIFVLITFVVVLFKQGKEGGDLVYEHGLNVKQVETVESILFDVNESLEETQEELEEALNRLSELKEADQNLSCNIGVKTSTEDENTSRAPSEALPVFTPSKIETAVVEEPKVEVQEEVLNQSKTGIQENNVTSVSEEK